MMNRKKIYTAGKMSGLTYDQQMGWRKEVVHQISHAAKIVNPPEYYNPLDVNTAEVEMEAMIWDLNQIRDSDIVLVNLDGIDTSIGTHCEIGFINAINSFGDKHIYLVGFGKDKEELHPWIRMSLFHWEQDLESALDYICRYLLV